MFSIPVEYTDFGGTERSETLRFDISREEMIDIQDVDSAFDPAFLARLSEEKNLQLMYKIMRKLILYAYGEISEDGKHFRKSDAIMSDFAHSAAYRALLQKILDDETGNLARDFILNVFPAKIAEQVKSDPKFQKEFNLVK